MLRVIVRTDEASMAAHVGGAVNTEYTTFDLEGGALEVFLRSKISDYAQRQVVGVILLEPRS